MTCSLLVTAGDGPAECNVAVGHILKRIEEEAAERGLPISIRPTKGQHGPKSAIVVAHGPDALAFAQTWIGTIQWRVKSPIRKHHKRSNWFVGVFRLRSQTKGVLIETQQISFTTLRAGGPGGQHQNTTDSAVRAVHKPSGLTVVVRDGRSQHRNKALAVERLQTLATAQVSAAQAERKAGENQLHHALERGNPIRIFKGTGFKECG